MTSDKCSVCKQKIKVMCRIGTDVCSTNCEKKRSEPQFAIAS